MVNTYVLYLRFQMVRGLLAPEQYAAECQTLRASLEKRAEPPPPPCDVSRASCRKWVALRDRRATSHVVARDGAERRRSRVQ